MKTRIAALILIYGGALGLAFTMISRSAADESERRPNILFIFTDDQSHRSVSCYEEAHPWLKTPNIDRLGNEGVRFKYAYIGTWCMPSRAQMLTGRLPHGIQSMRMQGKYPACTYDPQQCPFCPAVFRKAGYCTGMIGKWHTGFDTGAGRDWDYQAVWNHVDPNRFGKYYEGQSISFNGGPPKKVDGYSTDNYTRWAAEFIKGEHRDPKKPWYLWLCYDAVHTPYIEAERHRNDYRDADPVKVPKDIYPPRPTKPSYMHDYGKWKRGKDGKPYKGKRSLDDWVQKYNRTVRGLDEGVGTLLKTLEETGQLDNTLIVYTSDQGFAWGQHGFAWKYAPYDSNLRSPLLVRFPSKVAQGKVCKHPVAGLDLIPTFFAMAGIDLPWEMHGHDLTPLLADPDAEWSHPVLLEQTRCFYGSDADRIPPQDKARWQGVPWYVTLREGKYHYIRTLEANEIEELYDLEADPDELHNLACDATHRKTLLEFRAKTLAELRRTKAGMVENLPAPLDFQSKKD